MTAPLPVRLDDLLALVRSTAGDEPLEQLAGAVLVADELRDLADHLVGHFVDQARRAGASWTDIGRSMGVSKQAAQKRFVPRGSPDLPEAGNWARFTDRARYVVVGAQKEARATGYPEAGPEHVLLGLVADAGSVASKVIVAQGAALDTVGEAVLAALGTGP